MLSPRRDVVVHVCLKRAVRHVVRVKPSVLCHAIGNTVRRVGMHIGVLGFMSSSNTHGWLIGRGIEMVGHRSGYEWRKCRVQ